MKKTILVLSLICYAAITIAQPGSYTCKRKLDNVSAKGYYSIPLSPEILAQMKSGTSDIRIFNITEKDTTEIPYLMRYYSSSVDEVEIPYERINDSYNQKCCSYLTLKLDKKQVVNRIQLMIAENNFDKRVMVEGSNDNKQWFTIAEHLRIVRFKNGTENYTYSQLEIPNSEYFYIRLKFDDDSSLPVTVENAYAYADKTTEGKYYSFKHNKLTQTENKKEKRSEVILEYPMNYQFDYITLKSDKGSDYYRNINIYKSIGTTHTEKGDIENWVAVGSGVISSKENVRYFLYDTQTKKLKIEIVNYDDQPIKITDVTAYGTQIDLAAELPASGSLYLYYGKEGDEYPTYDLAHFQEKIPEQLKSVNYGTEEQKIISPEPPKDGLVTNKTWLWVIMGVVIAIIGYFALSMIKKEEKGSSEQ
jgi:hypothetical protein